MVYPGQFYAEFSLLSYYISILLALELGLYFLVNKKRQPEKTPTWTLTFSVFFCFTGILITMRAFSGVFVSMNPMLSLFLTQFNNTIATGETILIYYFSKDYFETKKSRNRFLFKPLMLVWAGFTIIQLIHSILPIFPNYLILGITMVTVFVNLGFPCYFIYTLIRRGDASLKSTFTLIFLGLVFAFMGLFLHSPDVEPILIMIFSLEFIDTFHLMILVFTIIYLGMITVGMYFLPPIEDFFWTESLLALYVLKKGIETPLFKRYFRGSTRDERGPKTEVDEGQYLAGGITGINELVGEMISRSQNKLEFIDQGSSKLLLSYEGDLIFLVVSKLNLPIMRANLYNFQQNFLLYFGDRVRDWNGDPGAFSSVEGILRDAFPRIQLAKEGR